MTHPDLTEGGDPTAPLWARYQHLVRYWRAQQRPHVVANYRHAHVQQQPQPAEPDTPPTVPLPPTPTPPVHITPIPLPPTPRPPRTTRIAGIGAGAGGFAALVFAAMMAAGWQHSPGVEILPALILVGLVIAAVVGSVATFVALGVERNRFRKEQHHYQQSERTLTQQMWMQDAQWDAARAQTHDTAAARMEWERKHADWRQAVEQSGQTPESANRTENGGAARLSDEDVLAQWDAAEDEDVHSIVMMAKQYGTAPENTPAWLGSTAAQLYLTATLTEAMTKTGWKVAPILSTSGRSVFAVSGTTIPADTTVIYHHATPEQIDRQEVHIVAYDDDSLAYRPAPGTDHSLPPDCPPRVIHTYTEWKIRGVPESEGYGLIGTDAYLATPTTLIDTVAQADE